MRWICAFALVAVSVLTGAQEITVTTCSGPPEVPLAVAAGAATEIERLGTTAVGAPYRWLAPGRVFERALPTPERGPNTRLVEISADFGRNDFVFAGETAEVVSREIDRNRFETIRFYLGESGELSTLVRRDGKVSGLAQTSDMRYVIRPQAGSWHIVADTARPKTERHARRRTVRSGPTPETIEIRQSFWYHSRLLKLWGSEENVEVILRSWVAAENTALMETSNVFVRIVPAWFEKVDVAATVGDSRPDYSALMSAGESARRLLNDKYVQQARFDNELSLATYVDTYIGVDESVTGSAAAYTYDETNAVHARWYGISAMIVGEYGMEVEIESMIHETGHSLGLNHEADNAPAGRCPYSYAFIDEENDVKDVMAYLGAFPRLLRYSNTLREVVPGFPFGDKESSDGARRIREVAPTARDFWKFAL